MMLGTGWIRALLRTPEREYASAAHIEAARARIGGSPDESAVAREPWFTSQGGRESCEGEFVTRCAYAHTGRKFSSQLPWEMARRIDSPGAPLENVGVTEDAIIEAARAHGAVPLYDWVPEDYRFDAPTPEAQRDIAQGFNLDVVPILASGRDLQIGLDAALDDGLPCGIVIRSDASYRSPKIVGGEAFAGPSDPAAPFNHKVVLWRRRRRADGRQEYLNPTSYGAAHGVDGLLWLPEERVLETPAGTFSRGCS